MSATDTSVEAISIVEPFPLVKISRALAEAAHEAVMLLKTKAGAEGRETRASE